MEYILVTGGLGFIGSHTCVELLNMNYNVIVIDNLDNCNINVKDKIEVIVGKEIIFYKTDLCDMDDLNVIFTNHYITAIIHFAGHKAVGESISNPLKYYNNNLVSTLNLLECMKRHNCNNLIFSSSATVYGTSPSPLSEDSGTGTGITNPYGKTKYMIEEVLSDMSKSDSKLNITLLRYFNPVGGHSSGLIGESPKGIPNNLMPYILRVAYHNNNSPIDECYGNLNVFGGDYNTEDGTAIRDYIHVVDLAKAHVSAYIYKKPGCNIYNIGSGNGYTVFNMINTFKNVNNLQVPYRISGRRDGDLEAVYCNNTKAKEELFWEPKLTLEDICRDAWLAYLGN